MNWSWLYTSSNPHAVAAKARNRGDGSVHNGRLLVDGEELVFEGDTARVAVPLEGVKISRNKIFSAARTCSLFGMSMRCGRPIISTQRASRNFA